MCESNSVTPLATETRRITWVLGCLKIFWGGRILIISESKLSPNDVPNNLSFDGGDSRRGRRYLFVGEVPFSRRWNISDFILY